MIWYTQRATSSTHFIMIAREIGERRTMSVYINVRVPLPDSKIAREKERQKCRFLFMFFFFHLWVWAKETQLWLQRQRVKRNAMKLAYHLKRWRKLLEPFLYGFLVYFQRYSQLQWVSFWDVYITWKQLNNKRINIVFTFIWIRIIVRMNC